MQLAATALGADGECLLVRSRNDAEAFADFYGVYSESILRFLASRLLDVETALDLMSETFAKALQKRRQFRGDSSEEERAWLFSIASSELTHYWRRGQAERRALMKIGISVPALSDPELERIEERLGVLSIAGELTREMHQLPDEQRRAVHLRVVDDLGYDEIASALGVTGQVVRARVSRGLRTLASALIEQGIAYEDVA